METTPAPLNEDQINRELQKLDVAWSDIPGQGLVRVYEMPDFKTGFALVAKIAEIAEEQQHHPEVKLSYDKVEVAIQTHSVGALTQADFDLAQALGALKI